MFGAAQAPSRSRGGLSTKVVAAVVAAGHPLGLYVLPGQRSGLDAAQDLIGKLPGPAGTVVTDWSFSAAWFRQAITPTRRTALPACLAYASGRAL